jgi:hypothetical protein
LNVQRPNSKQSHFSYHGASMAKGRKRGPKTIGGKRTVYNRARCIERLKPVQVENLCAADVFAASNGTALNGWLTVKFETPETALADFKASSKRLSDWYRRNSGQLIWLYVWEAIGGVHIHILLAIPNSIWQIAGEAIAAAFNGHDVLLKRRRSGPYVMAYLCKGTDRHTHKRLIGNSRIPAKRQGIIGWKRCGTSECIGLKARRLAGFEG